MNGGLDLLGRTNPLLPKTDGATRKEFLVDTALLALAPYGCGGEGTGAAGADGSGATRTFSHAEGASEIPVRPRRIVDEIREDRV